MDMKRRILSCFLAFCMIFALLPAPAQAAGNAENAAPTVTATVQHAATGQITAQIEAYMTDPANKTRTVKPCDIIFLIEQSKFMNTQNGSASSGDERAEILGAIDRLLDGMPQPTTGGEHRIAIAGYGRINNPGIGDTYDAALYPGTLPSSNESLNTGYYTTSDFHSQSGWTEYSKDDPKALPQLPSNYLTKTDGTDVYDNVFLSVDDAKQVIDADTMVPWHAGAARMDAGLTITERLAEIAKAEADAKDRNLIVCIAASSLPYQNNGTYQKLRPDAAKTAANTLKETYGATIFGLGDFNKLNLESSNPLNDPDKQRENFNSTMASICGNASTSGADYFKGLSQVHDIDTALNELMTKIDANVGEGAAEEMSINVNHFTEGAGGYSWSQLKDGHHILSAGSIREVASVDYYRFTGYDDSSGTPLFASTPSRHTEQSLADIGRGNAIQTSLNILPIPPQAQADEIAGANYGEKVVITITDPVCIDYDWIGRWTPTNLAPPKHEHAARGTTHKPAAPTQNAVAGKDLNLKFDGWYRLWDETIDQEKPTWEYGGKTYVKYTGTVFPAFGSDLKLYGRWLPEIQVSFHWAGSVVPVDGDGNKIAAPSPLSLSLNGDGNRYYKATAPTADGFEFDGWYKDSACTQKFAENGEKLTANTNLYGRWTRVSTRTVTFKVQNGTWSDGSTEDKTVDVTLRNGLGTLSADAVPTGMKPDSDHKNPGAWDIRPDTTADGISETGSCVYTYSFPPRNKSTVTYHWVSTENPDSAALPPQATVTEGTTYPVETVSNIGDWTFSGWYDNEACKGERVSYVTYENIDPNRKGYVTCGKDQNIDLYGKWTNDCTVTFLADYMWPVRGYLNADKQTELTAFLGPERHVRQIDLRVRIARAQPDRLIKIVHPAVGLVGYAGRAVIIALRGRNGGIDLEIVRAFDRDLFRCTVMLLPVQMIGQDACVLRGLFADLRAAGDGGDDGVRVAGRCELHRYRLRTGGHGGVIGGTGLNEHPGIPVPVSLIIAEIPAQRVHRQIQLYRLLALRDGEVLEKVAAGHAVRVEVRLMRRQEIREHADLELDVMGRGNVLFAALCTQTGVDGQHAVVLIMPGAHVERQVMHTRVRRLRGGVRVPCRSQRNAVRRGEPAERLRKSGHLVLDGQRVHQLLRRGGAAGRVHGDDGVQLVRGALIEPVGQRGQRGQARAVLHGKAVVLDQCAVPVDQTELEHLCVKLLLLRLRREGPGREHGQRHAQAEQHAEQSCFHRISSLSSAADVRSVLLFRRRTQTMVSAAPAAKAAMPMTAYRPAPRRSSTEPKPCAARARPGVCASLHSVPMPVSSSRLHTESAPFSRPSRRRRY